MHSFQAMRGVSTTPQLPLSSAIKNVQLQATGPDRFAVRARRLLGEDRKLWLEWRAEKLADFHLRLQSELIRIPAGLEILLWFPRTCSIHQRPSGNYGQRFRPVRGVEDALLAVGIRPALYRGREGVTFLRPHRIAPPASCPFWRHRT